MSSHLHRWETLEEVAEAFSGEEWRGSDKEHAKRILETDLKDAKLLFTWYEYEDYSGDALVIYEKDGDLYEQTGSHCSCNGLEGQWGPEKTDLNALWMRNYYDERKHAALKAFLEEIDGD